MEELWFENSAVDAMACNVITSLGLKPEEIASIVIAGKTIEVEYADGEQRPPLPADLGKLGPVLMMVFGILDIDTTNLIAVKFTPTRVLVRYTDRVVVIAPSDGE